MKRRRSKIGPVERFISLSDAEKAAVVAPFDRGEIPLSETRPLNAVERESWNRIQRSLRRGRPKAGVGTKVVSVSLERALFEKVDAFAKRHKLNRSQMVARGLRLVMERRAG